MHKSHKDDLKILLQKYLVDKNINKLLLILMLIESMSRHLKARIDDKGCSTKY